MSNPTFRNIIYREENTPPRLWDERNDYNVKNIFEGAATALITPFCKGKPDFSAFARIIDFQIEEGISALVVCGTTGEVSTLSVEERKKLIEFAIERCAGRVPLIAGTGGNSTASSAEMSLFAKKAGADAILSVAPYYNKGTRKGIIEHYKVISEKCELPVIVYNVPSRTGVNITPEIYCELSKIPGISAIKESNGSVEKCLKTVSLCGNDLTVYSGNDCDTLPIMSLGGKGVISVASNFMPKKISTMCRAELFGEHSGALKLFIECAPIFESLFMEVNPVPVKYAMSRMGFCKNELRLPLTPCEESTAKRIDRDLSALGLL